MTSITARRSHPTRSTRMDARLTPDLPLAELLGESPPEHGLMGRVLIVLIHCTVPAAMLAWAVLEPWSRGEVGPMLVFSVIFASWGSFLAESFRRFECWTWFVLMFALCPLPLALPIALQEGFSWEALLAAWIFAPGLSVMRYLWTRRRQFWADPPARRSMRPERRWGSPAWRAARLARMAASAPAARSADRDALTLS